MEENTVSTPDVVETTEPTSEVVETQTTEEPSGESVEQTEVMESEDNSEDVAKLLDLVKSKAKYMDKEIELDSFDTLIEDFQKGLDYNRQLEKKKSLETRLKNFDEIAKQLYPGNIDSTEQLIQALVENEIGYIEGQYKDKYPDDFTTVLKGDERYNALKNIKPIKIDTEAELESFGKDVESINKTYGETYSDYHDIPVEVREYAGEKGLSLMEAYQLKNFDKILDRKLENKQKSLMADIAEGRKKTLPNTKKDGASLSQFFSPDEIRGMNARQSADNYDKLVKSIEHWQKLGKM